MYKLRIQSYISANYGLVFPVEVWPEDTFSDIIRRICMVKNLDNDSRMFLELDSGERLLNIAKASYYNK